MFPSDGENADRSTSRCDDVDCRVVANALVWEQEEVLRQRDEQLNQKEDQLWIKNAHIGELEEQRQRQGERLSRWRGVSG
ncbi:MAG: hypothetical protein OXC63_04220 [Aestuariivita sp.]|nr:hypothetical protein [Aestuariivita sp.]MCY4345735.1 hypothetical protein [Aestuariivita sp.]